MVYNICMKNKEKAAKGTEKNWAEKLLAIIIWPFKVIFKILWKGLKLILKLLLINPITVIIAIVAIALICLFFI